MSASRVSLNGRFLFRRHTLIYLPAGGERKSYPKEIVVEGSWRLDVRRRLVYDIARSQNAVFGKSLFFEGRIEDVSGDRCEFVVLHRTTPALRRITRITLAGKWSVDPALRLRFQIRGERGRGVLVWTGRWKMAAGNTLTFTYRREQARRRRTETVRIRGRWKLRGGGIRYALTHGERSALEYSFAGDWPLRAGGKSVLKMKVSGVRPGRSRRREQFVWSGTWRIERSLLKFEWRDSRGHRREWIFSLQKRIGRGKFICRLRLPRQKPVSVGLKWEIPVAGRGSLFLRGVWGNEKRIEGGVSFPW
ncbi:MAG: hypothetical protein GF333_07755 [Candidatus Omnitrophica bacterium]|nr:hypothetical protein [Candidatus Omnitrophota bacterium]